YRALRAVGQFSRRKRQRARAPESRRFMCEAGLAFGIGAFEYGAGGLRQRHSFANGGGGRGRFDRHVVFPLAQRPCTAASTSSAWPSTLTFGHTWRMTPLASIRKVVRSMPI